LITSAGTPLAVGLTVLDEFIEAEVEIRRKCHLKDLVTRRTIVHPHRTVAEERRSG
jgi:hypothetical protein